MINNTIDLHTPNDLKEVRDLLIKEQQGLDPLTKEPLQRPCLDHRHDSECLVRGVLGRESNSFEGRVSGAFARYLGWMTQTSLPEVLRNLADYYDKGVDVRFRHPDYKKFLTREFTKLNAIQQSEVLKKFTDKKGNNLAQRKKIFRSLLTKSKGLGYDQVLSVINKIKEV